MELYLVRHGQTDWNKENKIQGRTDIALNEKGVEQAHQIKTLLKNVDFDVCYCSDLQRAKTTAEIIVGDRCPIIFDKIFEERYLGDLEGTIVKSYVDMAKYWDYLLNVSDNNVEKVQDLLQRGQRALDFIDSKYDKVLVVSHGAFIKAMHYNIVGYNEKSTFDDFYLQNCEYAKYNYSRVRNRKW